MQFTYQKTKIETNNHFSIVSSVPFSLLLNNQTEIFATAKL